MLCAGNGGLQGRISRVIVIAVVDVGPLGGPVAVAAGMRWPPRIFVLAPPESGFSRCQDRGVHYVLELWLVDAVLRRLRASLHTDDPTEADFVVAAQCFSHEFLEVLQRCRRFLPGASEPCFTDGTKRLNGRIRHWVCTLVAAEEQGTTALTSLC
mmetsp:Transcript_72234/g.199203  ORF Transcript_72234/g.199203 Transcript_72234/m.199203 type:complete len:155 (+) Transcript_72234:45-509(+)